MKHLILIAALMLAGCGFAQITVEELGEAEKLCASHGGLRAAIVWIQLNEMRQVQATCKDGSSVTAILPVVRR